MESCRARPAPSAHRPQFGACRMRTAAAGASFRARLGHASCETVDPHPKLVDVGVVELGPDGQGRLPGDTGVVGIAERELQFAYVDQCFGHMGPVADLPTDAQRMVVSEL